MLASAHAAGVRVAGMIVNAFLAAAAANEKDLQLYSQCFSKNSIIVMKFAIKYTRTTFNQKINFAWTPFNK